MCALAMRSLAVCAAERRWPHNFGLLCSSGCAVTNSTVSIGSKRNIDGSKPPHPMKLSTSFTFGLVALMAIGFTPHASAGIFSNNIDMLVVAETPDGASAQGSPLAYAAFDGGYIEAGDAIAGDTPPTPEQVSQSLRAALANQGFQAGISSPAVVLTYHWGVLRIDHRQIRVPYGIKSNLEGAHRAGQHEGAGRRGRESHPAQRKRAASRTRMGRRHGSWWDLRTPSAKTPASRESSSLFRLMITRDSSIARQSYSGGSS